MLNVIASNGVTGVLVVALYMAYKTGGFFAPLIENYLKQMVTNQQNIAETLFDLKELHKISNERMSGIEIQLNIFRDLTK